MFRRLSGGKYLGFVLCFICILFVAFNSMVTQNLVLNDNRTHRDKKSDDATVLEFTSKTLLDVYVVEEHHEVIPYWFDAVKHKKIPPKGNTLIHIDGHNDMAPPGYYKYFPFFRMPKDNREYKYLMQENDMFIMSAIIAGLISKVVWVWPSWDRSNHGTPVSHEKLEIGWMNVPTNVKNVSRKAFCFCSFNTTVCERRCNRMEREDMENDEGVEIDEDKCLIQRSIIFEEITEMKAVDELSRSISYLGEEGTILDIDEDYYGCTYAINPLLNTGISSETIEEMDNFIGNLFCPRNARDELRADRILTELLKSLYGISCKRGLEKCLSKRSYKSLKEKYVKKLFSENSDLLCRKLHEKNSNTATVLELFNLFIKLNKEQNRALRYVGFCFTTTPKTFELTSDSKFQICHGANTPNETAILVHKTNNTDIARRTETLKNILSVVKQTKPNIVTVCRSSRDGYVPREHFTRIENDVMQSLRHTFNDINIVYDPELMGGAGGWPSRKETL